ncbi:MAG: FAD:protein FMN transferase [Methylacidiphilales bacterium]|nr:FAD:protein FMN transferase [Candidatus Methylacidiphilales bacterium]
MNYIKFEFTCFASSNEILVATEDTQLAAAITEIAKQEAFRIERKYSRFRNDNIIHSINTALGKPIPIDSETYQLFSIAQVLHQQSQGMFDITAGVLNQVWNFSNPPTYLPSQETIQEMLNYVGLHLIELNDTHVRLQPNMQIDFGGIAKEYAVDRSAMLIKEYLKTIQANAPTLVNYGGDIATTAPPTITTQWHITIAQPSLTQNSTAPTIRVAKGGVATSGDHYKSFTIDNQTFTHFINPLTGYPLPKQHISSITVCAPTCMSAGMISTLAMLKGHQAEEFLKAQDVLFYVMR